MLHVVTRMVSLSFVSESVSGVAREQFGPRLCALEWRCVHRPYRGRFDIHSQQLRTSRVMSSGGGLRHQTVRPVGTVRLRDRTEVSSHDFEFCCGRNIVVMIAMVIVIVIVPIVVLVVIVIRYIIVTVVIVVIVVVVASPLGLGPTRPLNYRP